MRAALSILLLLASSLPGPARAAPPRRIVSLNLCADQYLIALADPAQIAALTRYARDPHMSYYARQASRLPASTSTAEEVLTLRPDLVLGAPSRLRDPLRPLEAAGTRFVDLPFDTDLAGIERSIRLVADAVGHPERGAALIASIRARLAGIGDPPGRGRTAADYQRRGFLTGTGTLTDEIMGRVGLVNLARRLDRSPLSQLSLEELALARPDFLVMESASRQVRDQGTELLHHPLLDRTVAPDHRLYLPEALTVCGGPGYAEAAVLLAAQIRAIDRRRR